VTELRLGRRVNEAFERDSPRIVVGVLDLNGFAEQARGGKQGTMDCHDPEGRTLLNVAAQAQDRMTATQGMELRLRWLSPGGHPEQQ